MKWMNYIMTGIFSAFSLFKCLGLRAFADRFSIVTFICEEGMGLINDLIAVSNEEADKNSQWFNKKRILGGITPEAYD